VPSDRITEFKLKEHKNFSHLYVWRPPPRRLVWRYLTYSTAYWFSA